MASYWDLRDYESSYDSSLPINHIEINRSLSHYDACIDLLNQLSLLLYAKHFTKCVGRPQVIVNTNFNININIKDIIQFVKLGPKKYPPLKIIRHHKEEIYEFTLIIWIKSMLYHASNSKINNIHIMPTE
jgi:hypothetical protein